MQTWEYKTLKRSRGWEKVKDRVFMAATEWNIDIKKVLKDWGEEGWELVAVVPRSSITGGIERELTGGISLDFAGFTNEELWVFKRPKP